MVRSAQEALGVLRGLQIVAEALVKEQNQRVKLIWTNSSIRESIEESLKQSGEIAKEISTNPADNFRKVEQLLKESGERTCVVFRGLQELSQGYWPEELRSQANRIMSDINKEQQHHHRQHHQQHGHGAGAGSMDASAHGHPPEPAHLDISSITLKELEDILSKRYKDREISLRTSKTPLEEVKAKQGIEEGGKLEQNKLSATLEASREIPKPQPAELKADTEYVQNMLNLVSGAGDSKTVFPEVNYVNKSSNNIKLPDLSKVAKQRTVPSSRLGRMASFGGLFAGLGLGTINELTKGALGFGEAKSFQEAFFSPANTERIVDTLCKVRGAALKIGQILSIQDSKVVSPQLAKAFERVRQAADYMPDWQVERVMNTQLGPDWREKLASFDDKPFAAASIGQVHRATLKNGMEVAIKIQYPGVAKSIESDIDNLVGMLKVWDVFPHGFFIDNVVKVAKRELSWEVDYTREAEYTEKFKEMVAPYKEYHVPEVIKELTTSSVLTTELVPGVPLDKCFDLSYEHRLHIGRCVMGLCLRELFEFQCMQTDPNWSNFLYDVETKRLMLIDFGSTRFYQKKFIRNYREVIMNAAKNDRQGVLEMSRKMGFLTGYETKEMEDAHVDAVMILGEIFRYDGEFDFGKQNTTERIAHLVPTMVAHRLCPPPEEIYSIHRKLSGIFLLCARLNIKMNCRRLYEDIVVSKFK